MRERLRKERIRLWDNAVSVKKDEKIAGGSLGAVVAPFANRLTAFARKYDDGIRISGGQFGRPVGTAPVRDDHLMRQGECRCQRSQRRFDNLCLVQGRDDDRNHAAPAIIGADLVDVPHIPGGVSRRRSLTSWVRGRSRYRAVQEGAEEA